MANLPDGSGDAVSNIVAGRGTNALTFTMPVTVPLSVESVVATIDNAAGAVTDVELTITDASGAVIATKRQGTTIPAAGSGTATWALRLAADGSTSLAGSGIPPFAALDDYVFRTANVTVTGIGFNDQTNLLIQGAAVVLDGSTRVKVEFFAPSVDISGNPPNNQAVGFELWDGVTNKGTMGYVVGNRKGAASPDLEVGASVKLETILTPSAGTHTYAIYGWKNVAGGTCVISANTFVDGSGNFAPMWYRLTTT